jgi:hypothetical protein
MSCENTTDEDLTLDCLAANLTATSKYITVFPTDCIDNIANSYFCIEDFYQNEELAYYQVYEQMDLLFDPVFEDIQLYNVMKKTNQVIKEMSDLTIEESYLGLFSTLWYMDTPCFDSTELKDNYGLT